MREKIKDGGKDHKKNFTSSKRKKILQFGDSRKDGSSGRAKKTDKPRLAATFFKE